MIWERVNYLLAGLKLSRRTESLLRFQTGLQPTKFQDLSMGIESPRHPGHELPWEKNVLHYALGGGLGHVVRQFGIAQQVQRRLSEQGLPGCSLILHNAHLAKGIIERLSNEIAIPGRIAFYQLPVKQPAAPSSVRDQVHQILQSRSYSAIVVDVFPRGIVGDLVTVLPDSNAKKILIARNLPANYLESFSLELFARDQFDRIIRIELEAPFQTLPQSLDAIPVVTGAKSHNRAGVRNSESPAVLLVGSGTESEAEQWYLAFQTLQSVSEYEVDLSAPDLDNQRSGHTAVPLLNRMDQYDLVVGNAGYNLHWECRVAGIPSLLFRRPRKYDNQGLRSPLEFPDSAMELHRLILEKLSFPVRQTPLKNRSKVAAELIVHTLI